MLELLESALMMGLVLLLMFDQHRQQRLIKAKTVLLLSLFFLTSVTYSFLSNEIFIWQTRFLLSLRLSWFNSILVCGYEVRFVHYYVSVIDFVWYRCFGEINTWSLNTIACF